jgi:hypothetical protein
MTLACGEGKPRRLDCRGFFGGAGAGLEVVDKQGDFG